MILLLGNGFVGEALSNVLIKNGHKVKVLSREIGTVEGVEYRTFDWSNVHLYSDFFDNVDVVIQTIHTSVPYTSMININKEVEDNIFPNLQLFDIIRDKNIKKTIFISSGGAVYGLVDKESQVRETHATNPISSYGVSKLTIEHYINLYNYNFDLNISIVRPSNLYGIGQSVDKKQGIIAHIIKSIEEKKEFIVWGNGKGVKDYLYIDDFIEAMCLLINKYPSTPQIYNIASGYTYSVLGLISAVEQETGIVIKKSFKEKQKFDVSDIRLDASKFKKDYNWTPKINIEKGIKQIINCM